LETTTLRIIAGNLRTRKIQFRVDPRTRPMKDRTREALMSLLGGTFEGFVAFDLFGGTGVLAFETVSRRAAKGVVFEILKSACREIQTNAQTLGVSDQVEVIQADVIDWSQRLTSNMERFELLPEQSWVVYCCPPYELWNTQGPELTAMLEVWWQNAPMHSLFAVELEDSTSLDLLPKSVDWDVRSYRPAQIAIAEKLPLNPINSDS
jgi:16S rRNA (guanine966-N2)-methyltransferase